MFYQASAFNQDIGWDTSQVTSMRYMFSGERYFNHTFNGAFIGGWSVESVVDFEGMFRFAQSFNKILVLGQPLRQRACVVCFEVRLDLIKTFRLGMFGM